MHYRMDLSYKNRKYVWVANILSSELAVSYTNVLLRIAELRSNNPDDMTAAVLVRLSYTSVQRASSEHILLGFLCIAVESVYLVRTT